MLPFKNYKGPVNENATRQHRGQMTAADKSKLLDLLGIYAVTAPLTLTGNTLSLPLAAPLYNNAGVLSLNVAAPLAIVSNQLQLPYFLASNSGMASASSGLSQLEVRSSGGGAFAAFHRPASFAAYFGLDSDNVWKVGGWSYGAVAYRVLHEGLTSGLLGNTYVGNHPVHGSAYAALWMNGAAGSGQYAVLSDGNYTHINGAVAVRFRRNNVDAAYINHNGTQYELGVYGRIVADAIASTQPNVLVDDIQTYRSANSATGVIYLNSATTRYLFYDGGQYVMPSANLLLNGVTVSSSRDYKENIRDLGMGAIQLLRQLRPRKFNFKEDEQKRTQAGFIFEEATAVYPELAMVSNEGPNGEAPMKGLDYNSIFTLNVKATQELIEEVVALRQRVKSLEDRLTAAGIP